MEEEPNGGQASSLQHQPEEHPLDDLARELAGGTISRRGCCGYGSYRTRSTTGRRLPVLLMVRNSASEVSCTTLPRLGCS